MRYFLLIFVLISLSPIAISGLVTKKPSASTVFYQNDTTMLLVYEANGQYYNNYYNNHLIFLKSRQLSDTTILYSNSARISWENNVEVTFDLTDYYDFATADYNYQSTSEYIWLDEDNKSYYKVNTVIWFNSCSGSFCIAVGTQYEIITTKDIRIYEGTRPEEKPVDNAVSKVSNLPAHTYLITLFALFIMTYRYKIKIQTNRDNQ